MQYSINSVAEILNGELKKQSGGSISYLLIDSRKALFARESLFFALRGERNDGHRFIDQLYQNGVRNFVVEEFPEDFAPFPRANFVKVANTLHALHQLAAWHRKSLKTPVLGITGSNGKTIVKEWVYQCLHKDGLIVRNPKSYNSKVGVPLSVWLLNKEAQFGVFEAGISKPGEMSVLRDIIQPNIGIFTNIGDAHQENFTDILEKVREKLCLFTQVKLLIYCADHSLIHQELLKKEVVKEAELLSWGYHADSSLQIQELKHLAGKSHIKASYEGKVISVSIPFQDKASVENAMHVWLLMLHLGLTPQQAEQRLSKIEPVGMRLELKEGLNQCTLINDSYNSDLESVRIALDFLDQQKQHPQRILILSDILQSGFVQEELYRQVANMVQLKKVDRLIGIGENISAHAELFAIRKDFFNDTQDFLQRFPFSKISNATILLKGARKFAFEEIEKALSKKSHRTVFEINLNALEQNLHYFRSQLHPQTGIIAMVKAFSYGSGSHEIANVCQYQQVAYLAVAYPDEGVELRKNGIQTPIMVMNPEQENFQSLVEYGLEPEIFSFSSLKAFIDFAGQNDIKKYPIHLKLDTGMHRSGFLPDEIAELVALLQSTDAVQIKSVFSHLAGADEPSHDEYTHQQGKLFMAMSEEIQRAFSYKIQRHILNSAGIERFPEYQFDYVRLGIGMYGVSAGNAPLAVVGTLKSAIAQIKTIKKGQTIGYNRKGVLDKDTKIATLTIGYADGYNRLLSNGLGRVFVNGKYAPIIGNVCMDMCMIDVSDLSVKEGDEVEMFGEHITISELAEKLNTIPYEILTSISRRVRRVYLYE